jgi:REP element-mobilizing transposase RayT
LRATDQVRDFLVGVSCHSPSEVRSAEAHGADFAVLAPIFEKAGTDVPAVGLEKLRITTQSRGPDLRVEAGDNRVGVPVLALGGVNLSNAAQCLRAGAAGLAGTRLFQEGKLKDTIQILRDSRYGFVARTPSSATLPTAKDYPLRYRRRLPHFQEDDRAVFITFKTNGSFHLTSEQRDIALRCCLHDHGNRYQLFAAVIMSNHVHLLLRPLRDREGAPFTLREILHALKGASAHFINRETGHKGPVWQEESFDHVIRGEDDFFDKLEYIESNPVTAGAVNSSGEYNWLWVADRL